ncbi:lysozyme inhibitor LprI family protein [Acidithiobacillus thiooxidans]|uniref:lysozyme inhibitor LprI family protein n=1 Tax=Acidithiobacillus thiooxidans TaxID=930 RepID=UPI0009DAF9EF|nr:lysozyme inhibitor LprI family protein [Acidithiobacillus thiooxidans]
MIQTPVPHLVSRTIAVSLLLGSVGFWAPGASAALPSASCSQAGTPTAEAICAHPELNALDARLADAYHHALASTQADSHARQMLMAAQRQWLTMRDDCRAKVGCLLAAYRERLAQLHPGVLLSLAPVDLPPFLAQHPDAVIHLTSLSPSCIACTEQDRRVFAEAVAHLPAQVAVAQVEWSPWYVFPKTVTPLLGSLLVVPTVVVLRDGKVVDRINGMQKNPAALSRTIDAAFRH